MTAGRKPLFLKDIWYRLCGVRTLAEGTSQLPSKNNSHSQSTVPPAHANASTTTNRSFQHGKLATCRDVADHRLVFLGEVHSMNSVTAFQRQVQAEMMCQQRLSQNAPKVHVVMEHFNFEQQQLLDDYMLDRYDFEGLVMKYQESGQEGHDLIPYQGLLEDAKEAGGLVQLHAGFLPRKYARLWMKEGADAVYKAASQWLPSREDWKEGTDFHYNVFETFFSGRAIFNEALSPTNQFRNIFQAQVLKDNAMAHKINQIIEHGHEDEKLLVIAGNGHVKHYCGVPERVLHKHPELTNNTCLVISESTTKSLEDSEAISKELKSRYGNKGPDPSDYVFFYNLPEHDGHQSTGLANPKSTSANDKNISAKEETRRAYDKVGVSAALKGNALKAAWIMYNMNYTEHQFQVAGADAYNFQGVGNPHIHAKIKPGETVLDVGSGLGIDSFIAVDATGSTGKVIGIDLSAKEVEHAKECAERRKCTNLKFIEADMESIPLPDNSVDVIISNGAFCLAPNKEGAFRELFRVLKPGGRMSVCTTTIQQEKELEPGVDWPLCMKMFINKKELKPMCEQIGFGNVVIDESDSAMSMEIPEEVLKDSNPERNRIHVGGDDFKHLEDMDMDKICARVCVVATKPS